MATQNVVAMSLRMRNTAVRTARDLKHEVKATGVEAQRMGTKFGHAVKASRTSVQGLAGSFVSLRTIIAATFAYRAIQRFGRFIKSLTELYKEQEDATRILGESLAGWNNYSKETVNLLHQQATAMQSLINVDNEEIESMMALLASYGMTGKEVSKVIGLTIDFARAKRIELKAAVDLVGKAFVGYTGTLSRYGIILDRNLTLEEKYTATLKELSAFKGVAAGMTETYAGKVGVLTKAYDDMKKQMGAVIARGVEQSGMLDTLAVGVKNVHDWFVKWEPVLSQFAAGAMKDFKGELLAIETIISEGNLPRWLFTIGNTITIVTRSFTVWFRVVGEGLNNITSVLRVSIEGWMVVFTLLKDGLEAGKEAWDEYLVSYDKMMDEVWRQRQVGAARNEETIANLKQDFKDLHEIWKADTGKDFLDRLGDKLEALRVKIIAERKAQEEANAVLGKGIQNRGRANEVIEETIKLTANMARQFALATRVEQEQIKFLMEKSKRISAGDVGGLTKLEKKLISSQNLLKEHFKNLMSAYSATSTGIELDIPLIDSIAEKTDVVLEHNRNITEALRLQTEEKKKQLDLLDQHIQKQEQIRKIQAEQGTLTSVDTSLSTTPSRSILDSPPDDRGFQYHRMPQNLFRWEWEQVKRLIPSKVEISLVGEAKKYLKISAELGEKVGKRLFERSSE